MHEGGVSVGFYPLRGPKQQKIRKELKMRHGDAHRRFNMPKSQRRALFANLTNALLTHEQITITLPRAKELRTFADSMITYAKKGDLNSRRLALSFLRDKEALNKVIWKVYYEKPYTDMIGRVIGQGIKTGIYKITNMENQMCYVG